jgi:hypothetical protein
MSDLESEQTSVDETEFHDPEASAMPALETREPSSSDDEVQAEGANAQQKKKRNRKARRQELKGEAVSVNSSNEPIDQINE